MMPISIIIVITSFLLQGIMSNYLAYEISNPSWFLTIYPLISILILIPYFENSKKQIILIIIIGLLVDVAYSNTFILNTSLFLVAYYISKAFHKIFPYNLLTINISNLINIIIYHTLTCIYLTIIRYDYYNLKLLLTSITHSILMTIIYSSIVYLITSTIYQRFELKEIK